MCQDCKFWYKEEKLYKGLVMGQCKTGGPELGPNGYGCWPVVPTTEICGQFKMSEMAKMMSIQRLDENIKSGKIPEPPEPPPKRTIREDVI